MREALDTVRAGEVARALQTCLHKIDQVFAPRMEEHGWSWCDGVRIALMHPEDLPSPAPGDIPFVQAEGGGADLRLEIAPLDGTLSARISELAQELGLTAPQMPPVRAGRELFFGDFRPDCIHMLVRCIPGRVTAYLPIASREARALATIRLLRTGFIHLACRRAGALQLHASAAANADGVVAFCGAGMAGKTTMLIEALSRGYDFVANDDCLCFRDDRVSGTPTSVGIRGATIDAFPALSDLRRRAARNIHRPREDRDAARRTVSVPELCSLFGRRLQPEARLTDILILSPDDDAVRPRLADVSDRERRAVILEHRHEQICDNQFWWDWMSDNDDGPPTCAFPSPRVRVRRAHYAPRHLRVLADMVL